MESFTNLIDQWPTRAKFADDCGQPYGVVHQWYRRNSIPAEHWPVIITAAKRRGLKGISLQQLANLRKSKNQ
jgi:hypothetical protein